jgi:glycosyltransferase involved in cell wall biosynthesis
VLYVGRADPYKNLTNLVRAFAVLKKDAGFPTRLVMVGADDARYPEARQMAAELGLTADVEWRAALPREELADVYRQAAVLVLPSWYEGFGLPAAEAMACGTPVICGDCGALREVAGDAGIFVQPADVAELARQMRRVLAEADLAADMTRRGLEQAKQFDWRRTAAQTLEIYRRAAEGRK